MDLGVQTFVLTITLAEFRLTLAFPIVYFPGGHSNPSEKTDVPLYAAVLIIISRHDGTKIWGQWRTNMYLFILLGPNESLLIQNLTTPSWYCAHKVFMNFSARILPLPVQGGL